MIITWVVLLVVLAGCLGGFGLRYQNEIRNNKVVTAVDYREFRSAANFADLDLASILADLKTAGCRTAVKRPRCAICPNVVILAFTLMPNSVRR